MKNVLVVVDMQNDFISGSLANEEGEKVTNNVIREINSKKYDYIMVTLDTHFEDYLNTHEGHNLPVEHCIKNTPGWELNKDVLKALKASGIDYKVYEKNTFGSFDYLNDLKAIEKELGSFTFVGLCTDICVISNALILRAKFPNLPMYVVEDACGGTTKEAHNAAIEVLKSCQIYNKLLN